VVSFVRFRFLLRRDGGSVGVADILLIVRAAYVESDEDFSALTYGDSKSLLAKKASSQYRTMTRRMDVTGEPSEGHLGDASMAGFSKVGLVSQRESPEPATFVGAPRLGAECQRSIPPVAFSCRRRFFEVKIGP